MPGRSSVARAIITTQICMVPKGVRRVEGHSTDIVTDLALDWLESRHAEKPFCLMIQHKAPHRNWKPSLKDIWRYQDMVFAEPASLFDDYESRVSAANHKMGIDQHMNLASDLMLLNEASDAKVLSDSILPRNVRTCRPLRLKTRLSERILLWRRISSAGNINVT